MKGMSRLFEEKETDNSNGSKGNAVEPVREGIGA
jgi:hypothetical protein